MYYQLLLQDCQQDLHEETRLQKLELQQHHLLLQDRQQEHHQKLQLQQRKMIILLYFILTVLYYGELLRKKGLWTT